MVSKLRLACLCLVALWLSGCGQSAVPPAGMARPPRTGPTLASLDPTTGAVRWSVPGADPTGLAVGRSASYSCQGGRLQALDAAGKPLWKVDRLAGQLTLVGDTLVLDSGRALHALQADTGQVLWTARGGPVVGGDAQAIVWLEKKRLVVLDAATGKPRWEGVGQAAAVGQKQVYLAREGRVEARSLAQGKVVWKASSGGKVARMQAGDGVVITATAEGIFRGLDEGTGKVRWSLRRLGDQFVGSGGGVFVVSYRQQAVQTLALSQKDASELWKLPPGQEVWQGQVTAADGRLFFCQGSNNVWQLSAVDASSGKLLWSLPLKQPGRVVYQAGQLMVQAEF